MIFYKFGEIGLPKVSCVYLIYNHNTHRYYVGSTVNFASRMCAHKKNLRIGKHSSQKLQRSFDKHGEQSFSFAIAVLCPKECVRSIEGAWMLCRKLTYNASTKATGGNGKESREIFFITKDKCTRFESTFQAAEVVYGSDQKNDMVTSAAKKLYRVKGGFFSLEKCSYERLHEKRKQERPVGKRGRSRQIKTIYAYSIGGRFLRSYQSVHDAAFDLDVSISAVRNVVNCSTRAITVKSTILSYDSSFPGLSGYGCKRPVVQKLNGSVVRRFDSTLSAAKEFSVTDSTVSSWCRGTRARNGFQWEYETT